MAYKWVNGRLVREEELASPTSQMDSLLDRRRRLEEATSEDRGGIMGVWDDFRDYARMPNLGEALDVISRPTYAVQEAIASAIDPEKRGGVGGSAVDALVGAGRGLWGTKKTSAIDTLAERGDEGALYTGLGLAADIALDPLTYVGAAPLRAVGAAEKGGKGLQALGKTTQTLAKSGDELAEVLYSGTRKTARSKGARKEATKAINRINAERTAKGLRPLSGSKLRSEHKKITDSLIKQREDRLASAYEKRTLRKLNENIADNYGIAKRSKSPVAKARERVLEVEKAHKRFNLDPLTNRKRKELLSRFTHEEAFSMAKAAQKAAEGTVDAKRAGLSVRFGKHSTEIRADNPVVSKLVDNPKVRTTASRVVNSDLVQSLNKKFRTEGTYGRSFNESRKFKHAEGVASYDDIRKAPVAQAGGMSIDNIVQGLTEKEAKDFFRAYELGDLTQLPEFSSAGLRYEDVAKTVKYHMDNMFDAELEAGLIPFKRDEAGNIIVDEATGLPVPEVKKLDNYLYHRATKNRKEFDKAKRKHYVKAVGSDVHEPAVERVFETAADAAKRGIDIDTDVRTALLNRTAKHTQAMARRNFLTDAVDNFGVQLDSKALKQMRADGHDLVDLKKTLQDVKKGSAVEYIPDGTFVPREIAEKLKGIESVANDPGPFLRLVDGFLKRWKPAVTIYNPGHHMRNFNSDVLLGFLDGVKNPKYYHQAADAVINKNTAGHLKIGNGRLRKDQVLKLFRETGSTSNFIQTEVMNKTAGRVGRKARQISEVREDIPRLAHFLSALAEEAKGIKHGGEVTQEVIDASARAAQRVKKWHLDYSDLTDFEKATMKRLVPFYTWMRKASPLMIEAMVLRPGKVANTNKSFQALFNEIGVDPGEALPTDQIPDWIREQVYGQIGISSRGNPLMMTPDVPFSEPFNWTGEGLPGFFRQGLASLNPIAKGPIEIGLGRSTFSGAPMEQGIGRYAAGITPVGRKVTDLLSGESDPDKDRGATPYVNWLLGAGIHEVTPSSQRGEVRRQIDMLEAELAKKGGEYPYKNNSQAQAPSATFVWENGRLVRKKR